MAGISSSIYKSTIMAVASKSPVTSHKPITAKAKGQTVQFPEKSRSSPFWLLRLCQLQQRFCAVTWLLMIAMLMVYGWTVYSQQKWNQAYSKLENLQSYERQLMRNNEVRKDKLALQAQQPDMGLVPPNPAEAIVLQPVTENSIRANKSIHLTTKPSAQNNQSASLPLGY